MAHATDKIKAHIPTKAERRANAKFARYLLEMDKWGSRSPAATDDVRLDRIKDALRRAAERGG